MISKEKLEDYAKKLMFQMNDQEYETLEQEFEVILKQMELINNIKGIKGVEPMTFPFVTNKASLREDKVNNVLTTDEALLNAKLVDREQVKVPKVVE